MERKTKEREEESKSTKGRKSRTRGKRFELQVRADLEEKGWTIVKWTNQVDFEKNTLISARGKFNPFLGRVMSEGSGFPDYMCYRRISGIEALEILKGDLDYEI